jgi:hypothetical protein
MAAPLRQPVAPRPSTTSFDRLLRDDVGFVGNISPAILGN